MKSGRDVSAVEGLPAVPLSRFSIATYPAVPLFLFAQFNLAKEIEEEEVGEQAPFQPLEAEQDSP